MSSVAPNLPRGEPSAPPWSPRWLGLFDPSSRPQIVRLADRWPRRLPCGGCGAPLNDRHLVMWAGGPFLCPECWETGEEARS